MGKGRVVEGKGGSVYSQMMLLRYKKAFISSSGQADLPLLLFSCELVAVALWPKDGARMFSLYASVTPGQLFKQSVLSNMGREASYLQQLLPWLMNETG